MPKCQFLFSAVFCSRKSLLRIFSELHETKGQVPIFPAPSRSPKERRSGATRWPHHMAARWAPWPRHQVRWAPRASTDAAPSPISSPRRENPKKILSYSTKSSAAPPPSTTSFGGQNLCSGTPSGRGSRSEERRVGKECRL